MRSGDKGAGFTYIPKVGTETLTLREQERLEPQFIAVLDRST